jgi:hypothetical protein
MFRSASRASWWLDAIVIFALAAALVFPVFKLEYLDNWQSIEGAFMAEAHALQATWPHHQWQPLWYCGTRADYVYPPGPRYAIAIVSTALRVSVARAYHVTIGFVYAFGFVVLYLWSRKTASRGIAWMVVAGVLLTSPCFLVIPHIRRDSIYHVPQRLHVLMSYGEGPHISSLAILPIAWLGAWKRLHGASGGWLALGAMGIALTVTTNFYGLIAVAITMPLLVWASLLEHRDWRGAFPVLRDAVLIAVLGWGLTAWWLVPSYVRVTTRNLYLFAPPGNSWSPPVALALLAVYVAVSLLVSRTKGFSGYVFFIASGLWWLGVYVLGFSWFRLQIAGDPLRLIPEFDVFAILCCAQLAAATWRQRRFRIAARAALLILLFFAFRPSWRYLKHAYYEFHVDHNPTQRVEYRTETWLYENFPNQRAFVTGTIRFWYNTWHLGQEADGAQQQSMMNPLLPGAQWIIMHHTDPKIITSWLQALGIDILVVPGKTSQEPYKDIEDPTKYNSFLPLLRDDGLGNRFYRVPRGGTGIVRIVDQYRLSNVPRVTVKGLLTEILPYAEAVESGPSGDRARYDWQGSDRLDVTADLGAQEALLVQETYDRNWRAYEGDQPRPIQMDAVGHMLVALPPGQHTIRLVFETPLEIVVGRTVAIVCLLTIVWLAFRQKNRAGRKPAPLLLI